MSPGRTAISAWTSVTLALAGAPSGCGRVGFDGDAGGDGGARDSGAVGRDSGAMDAAGNDDGGIGGTDARPSSDAGNSDASRPAWCNELPSSITAADCATAFATGDAADDVVYSCAASCEYGACYIAEADDCTCACAAYVKSTELCDEAGSCVAPLAGTGCLGGNFYSGPPINCPSGPTLRAEAACILGSLRMLGYCDGM